MPELPEVETIKRNLIDRVIGKKIKRVEVLLPRMIKNTTADDFSKDLHDKRIIGLRRRGKYLLFDLNNGNVLLIHLRMTGRLLLTDNPREDKYARVNFYLSDNIILQYADTRTLGVLALLPSNENDYWPSLANMGPEPLTSAWSGEYLLRKIGKRQAAIKSLLLDQSIVAGVGNIYADEALFLAQIQPKRAATTLAVKEFNRLAQMVNKVINDGINNCGTTFRDYRDGDGNKGFNQHYLKVYGRDGEACLVCNETLLRSVVGGRGTCYCPKCQK